MEREAEQTDDLEKRIQRRVGARVDQLKDGLIDLFVEEPFYYGKFVNGFRVFSLPYAFNSEAHRWAFLSSRFFQQQMHETLRRAGIRLINRQWNWLRGLGWVLVSNQPVVAPQDLRGLKVRVVENQFLLAEGLLDSDTTAAVDAAASHLNGDSQAS